jgi:hypothetical protein
MKITLQILGFILLLFLLGFVNAMHNSYKREKCVDMGGRFVVNTSDSNQSTCILEN